MRTVARKEWWVLAMTMSHQVVKVVTRSQVGMPVVKEMFCVELVWIPVVTNRPDMCPSPQTDHAAHDMAPGNTRNIGLP